MQTLTWIAGYVVSTTYYFFYSSVSIKNILVEKEQSIWVRTYTSNERDLSGPVL
eukprot:Pgem_evm1s10938